MAEALLDRARKATADYENLNLTRNAVFWAEKAVCLSKGAFSDVYKLANALYRDGQYRRAVHVLERDDLLEEHLSCRYLAALCDVAQKDFESAIEKLEAGPEGKAELGKCNDFFSAEDTILFAGKQSQIQAAVFCLYGTANRELLNMPAAHNSYILALQRDPMCYEAWDHLTANSVIEESKERELLHTVRASLETDLSKEDADTLSYLYSMRLQCKSQVSQPLNPPASLQDSSDVITCSALQAYTKYNVHSALESSNTVMDRDPLHPFGLLVHLACLVALEKKNELFVLAHEAVQDFPEQASSWYAVGCYYLTVSEFEKARMHFSKATSLDPNFGGAWVAFGHAFGADGIHDQANTCYFSAMKVMPGSHYPLVNVALYHSLTNDPVLAMKYLKQAETLSPADGIVCHERGSLALQQGDFAIALRYFKKALEVCQSTAKNKVPLASWEPLMNNIAHCYRRMKNYEQALHYHYQALALDCTQSSTHTSIGFVHSMEGRRLEAAEHFHKALRLNRQDIVATEMLKKTCQLITLDEEYLKVSIGPELDFDKAVDLEAQERELARKAAGLSGSDLSFLPSSYDPKGKGFSTPAGSRPSVRGPQPVLVASMGNMSSTPGGGGAGVLGTPLSDSPASMYMYPLPSPGRNDSMDLD